MRGGVILRCSISRGDGTALMGEEGAERRRRKDLLSLFSTGELRAFARHGLLWGGVLQLAILFVGYGFKISTQGPFPWKGYFFAAFAVPLPSCWTADS